MPSDLSTHVEEVHSLNWGGATNRDPLIRDSWNRCLNEYRIDPADLRKANILTDHQLHHHRDAMEELLRTARFGVEALYRQVSSLGYVVLLTDGDGITVDYIGNDSLTPYFRSAGLYLGADWNESRAGTCAVGTCIASQTALTVHQADHYVGTHIPLTCTAAPIFNADGRLSAVLDIAALTSPEEKSSQHLALQIVKNFAHQIETANLMLNSRRNWVIKLWSRQDFASVETEYVIALDSEGAIISINQAALHLLANEIGGDWRHADLIRGRSFSDFFECDIDALTTYVNSTLIEHNVIRMVRSRTPLFIQVVAPVNVRMRAQPIERPAKGLPAPLQAVAGEDETLLASLDKAARLVSTDISFLLQGETGTGKEFLAKALHASSLRSEKPFIPINCAALPETLIESELFGYEPGTFTGSSAKGKKGLIREADGGTLFLDEIGDMPLASQTRLLRVLSEREITPIGATRPQPVNVRVIAATHCDLVQRIRDGQFREDLYYRLNGAIIRMPSLRDRSDQRWLVDMILAQIGKPKGRTLAVSDEAFDVIKAYSWPGNIRQLVNVLQYAAAVATEDEILADDLPEILLPNTCLALQPASHLRIDVPDDLPEAASLRHTLRQNQWNISAAARSLGVDRTTLHRRMRRFGIEITMTDK